MENFTDTDATGVGAYGAMSAAERAGEDSAETPAGDATSLASVVAAARGAETGERTVCGGTDTPAPADAAGAAGTAEAADAADAVGCTMGAAAEPADGNGAGAESHTGSAAGESDDADATGAPVDYAALAARDLGEIKRLAPALAGLSHLAELPNALRYAALRDAGLSVEEALHAACHAYLAPRAVDNRAHLRSAVPIGAAGTPSRMTAAEMREARELFGDLTEGEIERLYARCQTE